VTSLDVSLGKKIKEKAVKNYDGTDFNPPQVI